MTYILGLWLRVPAHHPALPKMGMWVCRTFIAAVVAFALYLLLMHWKLWPLAAFWAVLAAPSVIFYLGWLFHSFRLSIKDDGGQAWIEPPESHMPYMPTMPPAER